MWIAKRTRGEAQSTLAESGTVSIGGGAAGVMSRGELREVPTAASGGYAWRPRCGERVLVVRGAEEDACWVVGSLDGAAVQETLDDGEVCIYSAGGASIRLCSDGRVEINGAVYVNGVPLERKETTDGA